MLLKAHQDAAQQDRHKVADQLYQQEFQKTGIAEEPAEVRDEHALLPDPVQIPVKHKDRGNGERADAAKVIGDERDDQQQNPVADHSWSPFCRIMR